MQHAGPGQACSLPSSIRAMAEDRKARHPQEMHGLSGRTADIAMSGKGLVQSFRHFCIDHLVNMLPGPYFILTDGLGCIAVTDAAFHA